MAEETIDLDELTAEFIYVRDARAALSKKFKDAEKVLVGRMDEIKHSLLDYCAENGLESASTASGTMYRTTSTKYWTGDWHAMHKFILENEVPEFLDKRLNQRNVAQFLEENPEAVPPGLNSEIAYTISIRKKT